MLTRAVVVLCATAALAAAYTVDCDREYADCDTQLSKLRDQSTAAAATEQSTQQTNVEPKSTTTARPAAAEVTSPSNEAVKPQPRLLDLEDLQSFANSLHNSTEKRIVPDLSDVTIDGDDDEADMNIMPGHLDKNTKDKLMPDKFYTNLKVPFNTVVDHVSEESTGFCTDNGVAYKPGDKIERGCEESCECMSYGWECSPRCKHPYIRRGRRLGDPLCFESPVDDCCSIVACASGDDGKRVQKVDTCKYENQTYTFGMSWNVGCEKVCTCDKDAVVSCKPRCPPLSQSERCINVQDPHDACCELQVCDVSQDGHEQTPDLTERAVTVQKPKETADDTAASTKEQTSVPLRPLVLAEPIGSVQVLQNNSVQVTLSHMNSSEDPIHLLLSDDGGKTFKNIQLEYTNLILNLEGGKDYVLKTAETGTKFNFTITATDEVIKGIEMRADEFLTEAPEETTSVKPKDVKEKIPLKAESVKIEEKNETQLGCMHDGMFYAIGEEFHIGCSELCECTGPEERECVALECPSHVGLELVSRGCVRWAPSPPAQPPNCCPREARCLSDGTCHFNGVPVPNWSEVPIALTGCERRCFCENGELDCQQLCAPLPPLPPATLRCPFGMHPAAVNVTDEDCCQEWSCVHNAATTTMKYLQNPVTLRPPQTTLRTDVLPLPPVVTYPSVYTEGVKPYHQGHLLKYIQTQSLPLISETYSRHYKGESQTDKALAELYEEYVRKTEAYFNRINQEGKGFPGILKVENPFKGNVKWYVTTPPGIIPQNDSGHIFSQLLKHYNQNAEEELEHLHSNNKDKAYEAKGFPGILNADTTFTEKPKWNSAAHRDIVFQNKSDLISELQKHYNQNAQEKLKKLESSNKQETYERKGFLGILKVENPFKENNKWHPTTRPQILTQNYSDLSKLLKQYEQNFEEVLKPLYPMNKQEAYLQNKHTSNPENEPTQSYKTSLWEDALNRALSQSNSKFYGVTKAYPTRTKPYSMLELENILSQIDMDFSSSHNMGRSSSYNSGNASSGPKLSPEAATPKPPKLPPPFIPTIPPDAIHFPTEDIPDSNLPGLPAIPKVPGFVNENKKLTVISLEADSPTSVKMLFGLPPPFVGLRGSVDLRYTDKADEDIAHWQSQVFAPADEILTTARLEFRLTGLKPSTLYKVRAKLFLHNLPVEPQSEVYTVRTHDVPVEEKQREVDSQLTVADVNDTVAHVTWRHFNEDELQYIDGIQIRYRPVGNPIYLMTELLHHSRSSVELTELRPQSRYEASLVLVAPLRTNVELTDPTRVEFTTQPKIDPYAWSVTVEAVAVGSGSVEVSWRGVPAPAERWVRVFRAAHACGPPRRAERDAFRLAARDQPASITLEGLRPDTRCRVWLELFLTNGKVKTSNVIEVVTKPEDKPDVIDNIIPSSVAGSSHRGDYYGALVAVGVIAALGAVTSLLLLLIVLRRHRPRAHNITPVPTAPRESSLPPYDNPAYKLELQQETMDL